MSGYRVPELPKNETGLKNLTTRNPFTPNRENTSTRPSNSKLFLPLAATKSNIFMTSTLKKLLPHLGAYLLFVIIACFVFKPLVFDGKVLRQGDNIRAGGMSAEMAKVSEETGKLPLWTNSMFAGMPSYQINYSTQNPFQHVYRAFILGKSVKPPHKALLLMMFGFYLLLISLKIDLRIAILGAIGFGFSAYYMDLVEAGHSTKIVAIAYLAPMLAGALLTFRKKYLLGGSIFAFFLALEVYANHLQITYYFFITLGILGLFYLFNAYKNQEISHFAKATGVLIIATLLGVGTSTSRLWTTYEYAQETIRGKSELTNKVASSGSVAGEDGLSKNYIFDWSYGKLETFNLLIPNYVGGTSMKVFANERGSASLSALQRMGDPEKAQQLANQTTHYWGAQPFTGSPAYMGIIFVFLFFLGGFLVKGQLKWWCVAATILTIFLAWGENFKLFNYFLVDYFPMFNKFRAVTMALGITSLFVALLGMLGLQEFFDNKINYEEKWDALKKAGMATGGLLLFGFLLSFGLDYGTSEGNFPADIAAALAEDRAGLLRADAFRSFLFFAVAFGALWFYLKQSWKPVLIISVLGILVFSDVYTIGKRVISKEDWKDPVQVAQSIQPSPGDQQIMADPDPHYRVADFRAGSPWSNALTSYHHKSIGGYHAAKLMRIQELFERYLMNPQASMHLYGMLNVKYFLAGQDQPSPNPEAMGNAWFVNSFDVVDNGDAEMDALANFKPAEKAIIQRKHASSLEDLNIQNDSTASIRLTSYHPDEMVYQYNANSEQLAVFSEVYYPPSKGWKMYLDGEPTDDFIKANFLLRAARLPAGNHELKMVFHPTSYFTGETITVIAGGIIFLLFIGAWYLYLKNNELPTPKNLPEPTKKEAVRKTTRRKKTVKKKKK